MCPLSKTIGMMSVIVDFHDSAQKVILESSGEKKVSWGMITSTMRATYAKVTDMKFELPRQPDEHFKKAYSLIKEEVQQGLRALAESA